MKINSNKLLCIKDKKNNKVYSYYDIILIKFTVRFASLIIKRLKLHKKLEQKEKKEFKQKITSIILHDLKNIMSSLEMSIKNIPLYFHYKEFRRDLKSLLNNTIKKIKQIEWKLSHIEKEKLNKTIINPSKEIKKIIKEFPTHNINLKINSEAKNKTIKFDKEKFMQIIKNLIINAIESITLNRKLLININLSIKNNYYIIIIEDNGKGIKKDFLCKLFTPFTSTKPKGLGLGLYNCKEILRLHNSDISIQSYEGKGTKVKISIKYGDGA